MAYFEACLTRITKKSPEQYLMFYSLTIQNPGSKITQGPFSFTPAGCVFWTHCKRSIPEGSSFNRLQASQTEHPDRDAEEIPTGHFANSP